MIRWSDLFGGLPGLNLPPLGLPRRAPRAESGLLPRDAAGERWLGAVIGVLCFLACLAAVGAVALAALAAADGISGTATMTESSPSGGTCSFSNYTLPPGVSGVG